MRDFLDANGNIIEKLYRMAVSTGQEQHIEACSLALVNKKIVIRKAVVYHYFGLIKYMHSFCLRSLW